jgi:hypothetical protein
MLWQSEMAIETLSKSPRARLICVKRDHGLIRDKVPSRTDFWSTVMSFANVMVNVDPQQQEEGQMRVAKPIAKRFGGAVIGVNRGFRDAPNQQGSQNCPHKRSFERLQDEQLDLTQRYKKTNACS